MSDSNKLLLLWCGARVLKVASWLLKASYAMRTLSMHITNPVCNWDESQW